MNSIFKKKKHVSEGQGRTFSLPGPFANGPPPLASTVINRIALQGSHRYSRRGHNTIVLQLYAHIFAAGSDSAVCLPSTRLDARWCRRLLLQQHCAQVL